MNFILNFQRDKIYVHVRKSIFLRIKIYGFYMGVCQEKSWKFFKYFFYFIFGSNAKKVFVAYVTAILSHLCMIKSIFIFMSNFSYESVGFLFKQYTE